MFNTMSSFLRGIEEYNLGEELKDVNGDISMAMTEYDTTNMYDPYDGGYAYYHRAYPNYFIE